MSPEFNHSLLDMYGRDSKANPRKKGEATIDCVQLFLLNF